MSKKKLKFECKSCLKQFAKWQGKCDQCSAWDSIITVEQATVTETNISNLAQISIDNKAEIWQTGVHELDRVLGKGIVCQSIGLLGGPPGIGKSTLILQILGRLARFGKKVLYLSGEESAAQIKMRAERLQIPQVDIFIQIENNLENIFLTVAKLKPDFVVIDSIQTIASEKTENSAGSLSQIRECTMQILQYSKKNATTFLLVGHITKEGSIAGPKTLEHMVDYVLYLEEENNYGIKTLKAVKNRFGSIYETGLFKMTAKGLAEISQPNKIFLNSRDNKQASGTALFPMLQGNRTLLVEVQALVGKRSHPASLKTTLGIDRGKLLLLIAVIDKYLGIDLHQTDVYLNIAGGYRCSEPLLSLSMLAAILSSYSNKSLPAASVFLGEVALTGRLSVNSSWKTRLKEVEHCGFKQAFLGNLNQEKETLRMGKLEVFSYSTAKNFYDFLTK